ncbi:MAG: NINE protein [Spirochaetaceae bacterium]|jgi:hypothetical protein|nr:NINE protein [Spirochaetaceae bacterium]
MFCEKCGTSLEDDAKFCDKCGAKVEAAENENSAEVDYEVVDSADAEDEGARLPAVINKKPPRKTVGAKTEGEIEINDIAGLQNRLNAIRESEDNDTALSCAIEAQLQVLDTLGSPEMSSGTFDLMIQALNRGLQQVTSETEKKEMQERASIMAVNMVFFMEAKLRYEEDKYSKMGKELLKKGCTLLAQSSAGMLRGGIAGGVRTLGAKLYDDIANNGGFFDMLFDFIGKKERLAKNQTEFQNFIFQFIGKLDRYGHIFGKSVVLSEFVLRYKDMMLQKQLPQKPAEPAGPVGKGIWVLSFFMFAVVNLILGLVLISALKMPVDTFILIPITSVVLWLVINIIKTISGIAGVVSEKNLFNKAQAAYERLVDHTGNYYEALADKIGILSPAEGAAGITLNQSLVKSDVRLIEKYNKINQRRVFLKGTKSKTTAAFLCLFLGFLGAHRFYVGRTASGVVMILLVETGISFIWAIVDFARILNGSFTDKNDNPLG